MALHPPSGPPVPGASSHAPVDAPGPVRAGEELPVDRLAPWLRQALGSPDGEVRVEQFPGGHSNLTYLVRVDGREAVLRRPPAGSKVRTAHDMGREFLVLSHLAPVYPRAPRVIAFCDDESLLGARFYLMERIPGVILRRRLPAGIDFGAATMRRLSESFVAGLAELHAIDWRAAGLGDFGRPEGYVERQVRGWTQRYRDSQTDEVAEMDSVASWLAENLPPLRDAVIIHNDYKYDNLVLDPADITRVVGLLDWEMSTIGDPFMDLGTALCYWVEEKDGEAMRALAFGPTALPGSFTRGQLVERYCEASGRSVDDASFYYCFGLFKTAVVVQQIYYRFEKGLTRDPRFAQMIEGVRTLARQAAAYLGRREV
jgi:aminoglycoside phosphotransferase (APT) family kinase protein